jgi:hypothetical protein
MKSTGILVPINPSQSISVVEEDTGVVSSIEDSSGKATVHQFEGPDSILFVRVEKSTPGGALANVGSNRREFSDENEAEGLGRIPNRAGGRSELRMRNPT